MPHMSPQASSTRRSKTKRLKLGAPPFSLEFSCSDGLGESEPPEGSCKMVRVDEESTSSRGRREGEHFPPAGPSYGEYPGVPTGEQTPQAPGPGQNLLPDPERRYRPSLPPVRQAIQPPIFLQIPGKPSGPWGNWRQCFQDYLRATQLLSYPDEDQLCALRQLLGVEGRRILASLGTSPQIDSCADVLDSLGRYSETETLCSLRFGRCAQQRNQSVDQFLAELTSLARACEFGASEEDRIRDQFVLGLASETTRNELVKMHELSLRAAHRLALQQEAMARTARANLPELSYAGG